MAISPIEEVVADMQAGRMVIMLDDAGRENEGDLIMAAECVRPEDINFMARYGRGLICLTLTRERCRQLHLPLMVATSDTEQSTNFTLSIEAAEGVTTGISAHDRAQTVRAAVKRDAQPSDLVQPGHIFPLMSQPGGTLARAVALLAFCSRSGYPSSEKNEPTRSASYETDGGIKTVGLHGPRPLQRGTW